MAIKKKKKLKAFKVETFDGGAYMTFFTQAEDHKKALQRMEKHSYDYDKICKKNSDLTIKVVELK
jgi:hypothetical protein